MAAHVWSVGIKFEKRHIPVWLFDSQLAASMRIYNQDSTEVQDLQHIKQVDKKQIPTDFRWLSRSSVTLRSGKYVDRTICKGGSITSIFSSVRDRRNIAVVINIY